MLTLYISVIHMIRCEFEDINTVGVLMNVRTVCLAILYDGESTGYEIKKLSTEGKYSHFVDASFGSIYPSLNRMESEGLVTVREEQQSGKPARKIYAITDLGRQEFIASLEEPCAPDVFRSQFLLVAMSAHLLPKSVVSAAIDRRVSQLQSEADHLQEIVSNHKSAGGKWAATYGLTCMRASQNYLSENREALESIALSERTEQDKEILPDAAE